MFRSSFDKNLDSATSHLRLEPDWPSIMMICDGINQKDVTPKNAFAAIKKKMNSPNPHSAYYALLVLESVVKNCGVPMHDEVFTKDNCKMFSQFLEQTSHENVRTKMLELIQTWAYAFRLSDKYQAIKDTLTILKTNGHPFPELKEADAMFTTTNAPNWADGKVCHRCRVEFTITNRKHHCRHCGQVFCGQCTTKQCPLPKYGIEKEVRVCDGCYAQLQRPNSAKTAIHAADSDLPAEYLNSSLAQQVQTPPRKSEQELKEEEELQLAIALSQSEAEIKKQQKQQPASFLNFINIGHITAYRLQQRSPSPEASAPKEVVEENNPDLEKYLNRSYWEQRKINDSPMASPSAPSPMPPTPQPQQSGQSQVAPAANDFRPKTTDEQKIDEFAASMRASVEIFVNRMKSNSSRGRSIANDSAVQSLFMNLTSMHSQQLSYIKELDDKRMWYEQLQDKITQIKDSRAALDLLRQEHAEKLRLMAEEQERQRQIQMAQKLEIMRKKKQEYLQYQRQIALKRIQDQEREMQLRQEQQIAQYRISQTAFPFMPALAAGRIVQNSPPHQMTAGVYNPYTQGAMSVGGGAAMPPYSPSMATAMPGMYTHSPNLQPPPPQAANIIPQQQQHQIQGALTNVVPSQPLGNEQQQQLSQLSQQQVVPPQRQQHQIVNEIQATQPHERQPQQLGQVMLQQQHVIHSQAPIPNAPNPPPPTHIAMAPPPPSTPPQQQQQQQQAQQTQASSQMDNQIQAINSAPVPPQHEPEPKALAVSKEPATAELISFD
uniref:Hepatocyte growth factor-regulated tyrosine kinase substrate n=1 Tax=Glossina brevipalpis TaxID=37001 RepID=A0A1A9WKJ1_9MUSC